MKYVIVLYSLLNRILEKIGFKLDYIGSHRYAWIKKIGIKYVIDIGANKGQTIEKYKKIFGNSVHFYSFEPLSFAFDLLQKKFSQDPHISLFNFGLGNENSTKELHIHTHDDSSSLLESSTQGERIYNYHIDGKELIKIKTLDSVFDDITLSGLIMMKIDIQGYELQALQGGELFLKKVTVLIIEMSFIELYTQQACFGEVYDWLTVRGFKYAGSLEQAGNPIDGQPLQQDAIFINNS